MSKPFHDLEFKFKDLKDGINILYNWGDPISPLYDASIINCLPITYLFASQKNRCFNGLLAGRITSVNTSLSAGPLALSPIVILTERNQLNTIHMSNFNLSNEHVASLLKASLSPETAKRIADSVIDACSKSDKQSAEFNLVQKDGLPCIVSVKGPFGICICIAPPGADC